jgi:hypothetical protein
MINYNYIQILLKEVCDEWKSKKHFDIYGFLMHLYIRLMLIFPKFHQWFLSNYLGVFVEIKIKISKNFNIATKKNGKSMKENKIRF